MRVLVCSLEPPLPPYNGLRLPLAALLDRLRETHDVRLVCLTGSAAELRVAESEGDSGRPRTDSEPFGQAPGRPARSPLRTPSVGRQNRPPRRSCVDRGDRTVRPRDCSCLFRASRRSIGSRAAPHATDRARRLAPERPRRSRARTWRSPAHSKRRFDASGRSRRASTRATRRSSW